MGFLKGLHQYLTPQGDGNGRINAGIKVGALGSAVYLETGGTIEDQWTLASNKLEVGDVVRFTAVGTGATGYAINTDYYVAEVNGSDKFSLATALGGAAIEGVGDSGGTWTLTRQQVIFYIQPGATERIVVTDLIAFLQDATSWDATEYGSGSALANGITVRKMTGTSTLVEDITVGHPVQHNAEWTVIAHDRDRTAWGAGDEAMTMVIAFGHMGINPGLILDGSKSDRLEVLINDDLSGLTDHRFLAHGYYPDIGA